MSPDITHFINYIDHRYTDKAYKGKIDQNSLREFEKIKNKYVMKIT